MSERKVINKYYPPDYDPSKIIKKKKKVKTGSASLPTIRLMTPFSMKCDNCGDYISKSRKFNARKETTNDTYLGMKIVRFHIKCPTCSSEILFRTDPKSANFVIEFGAKKNYDSENTNKIWEEETVDQILDKLQKEEEESKLKEASKDKKNTSLEELEKKMNDLKRQQELSDEIDDLRDKNKKFNDALVNVNLQKQHEQKLEEVQRLQDEEDEKLAEEIFKNKLVSITKDQTLEDKSDPISISNSNSNSNPDSNSNSNSDTKADSDSDSDSEYEQPVFQPIIKNTIPSKIRMVKRKTNDLGISLKKVKR